MPPRAERQFHAEFVRQGGVVSKALVTIQCSRCPVTKVHESRTALPDEVISKRLKSWGWVLGRNRNYDICPTCAGVTAENKLASRFRVISEGKEVATPREVADTVGRERARRSSQLDALIDKTFRLPQKEQVPQSAPPPETAPVTAQSNSSPSPAPKSKFAPSSASSGLSRLEEAITGMANDIGQIRAAVELLMEQIGTLVGLQGQQVQAVANLSGIVAKSNEGIAVSVNMLTTAIREMSRSPAALHEPSTSTSDTYQTEFRDDPPSSNDIDLPPLLLRSAAAKVGREPSDSSRQATPRVIPTIKTKPREEKRKDNTSATVSSYRDGKKPTKFYTIVQLPKALWLANGFRQDDRVIIGCEDGEIAIKRTREGGIKLKKVTDAMVLIQTTRVGDLNFEAVISSERKGEIRLHS